MEFSSIWSGASGLNRPGVIQRGTIANIETVSGTQRRDIFTGTDDQETLVGHGGNDEMFGRGEIDSLYGGLGADTLFGEAGADTLNGGSDADTLSGGADDDRLDGETGNDDLNGGDGRDLLFGGDNADLLEGGGDVDTLDGGTGADQLFGGNAEDRLDGGAGSDVLTGGGGADTFVFSTRLSATGNRDRITDYQDGSDRIVLASLGGQAFEALGSSVEDGELVNGTAPADDDDFLIYDPATGILYFDRDGAGGAAKIAFAIFDIPLASLQASDFLVE